MFEFDFLTRYLPVDVASGLYTLRWSLDVVMQGTLLLLLAGAVSLLLRRASASLRHLVWLLTLSGLLALPLLSRLMPRSVGIVRPANTFDFTAPTTIYLSEIRVGDKREVSQYYLKSTTVGAANSGGVVQELVPVSTRNWFAEPWSSYVKVLWLIGVLFVAARIAVGLRGIRGLERGSTPLQDGELAAIAREAQRALGYKRTVRIRLARPESAIKVPLTWGWWRPTVLLPAEAQNWMPLRQRTVLLHEFAHVVRGDWWMQIAAQIVCAIYWFHPLVWRAASSMRAESERATDDRVLAAGVRASDYSECLLAFVNLLGADQKNTVPKLALGMVRRGAMEGRLRAILDARSNRRSIKRVHVISGAMAVVALLLTVATVSAVDAPPGIEDAPIVVPQDPNSATFRVEPQEISLPTIAKPWAETAIPPRTAATVAQAKALIDKAAAAYKTIGFSMDYVHAAGPGIKKPVRRFHGVIHFDKLGRSRFTCLTKNNLRVQIKLGAQGTDAQTVHRPGINYFRGQGFDNMYMGGGTFLRFFVQGKNPLDGMAAEFKGITWSDFHLLPHNGVGFTEKGPWVSSHYKDFHYEMYFDPTDHLLRRIEIRDQATGRNYRIITEFRNIKINPKFESDAFVIPLTDKPLLDELPQY